MATDRSEFTPIVFLHIPKTAGQTIHHALAKLVAAGPPLAPLLHQLHAVAENAMRALCQGQ